MDGKFKSLGFSWSTLIVAIVIFTAIMLWLYTRNPVIFSFEHSPRFFLIFCVFYLSFGLNQNTFRFDREWFYIRNPMLPFLNKTILLGDIKKIAYRNVTGNTLTPAIEVKLKNGKEISRFYQGSSKKVRLFLQHFSEATGINYEEET